MQSYSATITTYASNMTKILQGQKVFFKGFSAVIFLSSNLITLDSW